MLTHTPVLICSPPTTTTYSYIHTYVLQRGPPVEKDINKTPVTNNINSKLKMLNFCFSRD